MFRIKIDIRTIVETSLVVLLVLGVVSAVGAFVLGVYMLLGEFGIVL